MQKKNDTKTNNLENQLKRALADYQNLEKRFEKESQGIVKFANSVLLVRILELKDNLERAVLTIKDEGLDLVLEEFEKILKDEMVAEIDAKGQEFDPNTMEAEEIVPGKKNTVQEVIIKGYTIHDRILRPATVKVGSGQTLNKRSK